MRRGWQRLDGKSSAWILRNEADEYSSFQTNDMRVDAKNQVLTRYGGLPLGLVFALLEILWGQKIGKDTLAPIIRMRLRTIRCRVHHFH
jgi:hypothetical protein